MKTTGYILAGLAFTAAICFLLAGAWVAALPCASVGLAVSTMLNDEDD